MPSRVKSWNDEFRPRTIDECILPSRIKQSLLQMQQSGDYQSMLFVGGTGRGKTTCADVLCSHPNVISRSVNLVVGDPKDIKEALSRVRHFMRGGFVLDALEELDSNVRKRRVVFVDEAQLIGTQEQERMKLWIEADHVEATFILALNDEQKLLPSLRSRLVRFDFEPKIDEYKELVQQAQSRCEELAARKGIALSSEDIEAIVKSSFPDLRVMVNELYKASLMQAA